jgi:type I restriction enzyme S subunit
MPKLFDFGELPFGWTVSRLSEVTPTDRPIVYGIVQAGPHCPNGVPYIRSTDVGGELDMKTLLRTSPEIAAKYRRADVRPGDLVFSLRGNIGEASIVPTDLPNANLTQGTARIAANGRTSARFIRLALSCQVVVAGIDAVAKGSTFREISIDQLRKVRIPVPPLPEQEAIVSVISNWDRGLRQLTDLIAAKVRFKQGLMQQLLTGKRRFTEFGGAEWGRRAIGSFLTESRIPGSHGGNAKKITVKLYGKGVISKSETRAGSAATKYHVRRQGQFIYSKLDFLNGAFGIIPEELDGYESTLDLPAFDIDDAVDAEWFRYFVVRKSFYKNLLGLANGGRKARRVNPNDMLQVEIPFPTKKEQSRIAQALKTLDHEIGLLRKQLEALKHQKKGLTGEVRVKLPEEVA